MRLGFLRSAVLLAIVVNKTKQSKVYRVVFSIL